MFACSNRALASSLSMRMSHTAHTGASVAFVTHDLCNLPLRDNLVFPSSEVSSFLNRSVNFLKAPGRTAHTSYKIRRGVLLPTRCQNCLF